MLHRLMVLHADHGFNASTFAARVTASTNSDMYSAVTSAIGTLRGPLHGGASEKVMEMLDDIGMEEHVEVYIQGLLDDDRKVMGFGHRVYKVEDPRTKHLRGMVENLCHRERTMSLYNKCMKIEEIVRKRRRYTRTWTSMPQWPWTRWKSPRSSSRHSSPPAEYLDGWLT